MLSTMFNNKIKSSIISGNAKRSFFMIVNQQEVAYREFLGSNRVKLEAGIRLKIPYIHSVNLVDMRECNIYLENLECFTKEGVPVYMSGTLFYQINNAEDALYKVKDFITSMHSVCTSAARSSIGSRDYDSINKSRISISSELEKNLSDSIQRWGIICTKFEVMSFEPRNKEMARKLELQMEAERNRRENELNTRAKVNTAEGEKQQKILKSEAEKQSIILKSEADFLAAKNTADANLMIEKSKSDAEAYRIRVEAEANAELLKKISDIVGSENAVKYLLESKKYAATQSIATGPNSKVFFMPNALSNEKSTVVPMPMMIDPKY